MSNENEKISNFGDTSSLDKNKPKLPVKNRLKLTIIVFSGIILFSGLFLSGWYLLRNDLFINQEKGGLKLSLSASKIDSGGIDKKTSFILKSSEKLSAAKVKGLVAFKPEIKFSVNKKPSLITLISAALAQSENNNNLPSVYEIVPEEDMLPGKIYQIYAATSSEFELENNYSWAFQVKAPFQVSSTFPGDKATDLPVNTGIEITFNRDGIASPEEFFAIEPQVMGKFEKSVDKFIFIPNKLAPNQIYKITIKKGYNAAGTEDILDQDFTFIFETGGGKYTGNNYFNWSDDFIEFTPDKNPVINVYSGQEQADKTEITVYKFASGDDFIKKYQEKVNNPLSWAYSYNRQNYYKVKDEIKLFSFKPTILKSNYRNIIELPQKLETGYYLLDAITGGLHSQAWLEISPLAYYFSMLNTQGFFWLYDFPGKMPLTEADLFFINAEGGEENIGRTDNDGLVEFDTPPALKINSTDGDFAGSDRILFFKIKSRDLPPLFVPTGEGQVPAGNKYWNYISADRYAYQMSDKINFWGIIKGRNDNLKQKKIKIGLYDYFYDKAEPLAYKEITVSEFDTVEGSLSFKGLSPRVYQLVATFNDELVANTNVEILTYTKPAYQIIVTPSKNKIFAGDKAEFNVKANFFDGTPVSDLTLNYNGYWQNNISGELKLDKSGEAVFSYTPPYYFTENKDDDGTYYPQSLAMYFRPKMSEEGEIESSGQVMVFGPDIFMQTFFEKKESDNYEFKAKLNKIVINEKNAEESVNEYIGDSVTGWPLQAQVIKITYFQVEDGEYYDPIDKVTRKSYRYDKRDEIIKEIKGQTNENGEWIFNENLKKEKDVFYRLIFSGQDSRNHKLKQSIYTGFFNTANTEFGLGLNIGDGQYEKNYKINDEIKISASIYGNKPPYINKFLYYRYQNGIGEIWISDTNEIADKFKDNFIPSVNYRTVAIGPYGFVESNDVTASLDKKEKELKVEIKTDKEKYKPQEEINISLNVRDKDNNGHNAQINVAAVDEALFHILPYSWQQNILPAFYANIYSYPVTGLSQFNPPGGGAEMGGCFLAGTQILLADNSSKPIENIKIGDEILTFKGDNNFNYASAFVQGISEHDVKSYLIINDALRLTPEHKIYLNGNWQFAGLAKIGDELKDYQGNNIFVKKISGVNQPHTKVYNIVVSQYHTYFAQGVFVHNAEKGGGYRSDFIDVPLFKTIESGRNGQADISFKAPDNITSWRLSVKAYEPEKMLVGEAAKLIPVSLPFFVDTALSDKYLAGDSPLMRLRAYGQDYKPGEPITFAIDSQDLNLHKTQKTINNSLYFPLGDLKSGRYNIIASATQQLQADGMEKKIEVVDNYFRQSQIKEYIVDGNAGNFVGNQNGFTDLMIVDAGKGQYFSELINLSFLSGIRADQKTASFIALSLLADYFSGLPPGESLDLSSYSQDNGAMSLFPYGGPELELSAMLADAAPDFIYKDKLRQYFNISLSDKLADIHRIAKALYGLACLDEPVLNKINFIKDSPELNFEDRIYIALALAKLGDNESARKIYSEKIKNDLRIEGGEAWLDNDPDRTKGIKLTATIGILASYLNEKETELIWNYLTGHNPVEDLDVIEETIIARNQLERLKQDIVSFDFKTDKRENSVRLVNSEAYKITLSADELKTLSFSNIRGQIKLISYYEESADPDTLLKNNDLSIKRQYFVNNQPTKSFKEGEIVLVRLFPKINKNAIEGPYQVVDYLPSGLKPITKFYSPEYANNENCNPIWYPAQIIGNAVYFNIYKGFDDNKRCDNNITLNYYARVISQGKYRAQPAIIQSLKNISSLNISNEEKIEIK